MQVEGVEIAAHKAVLATNSDYFLAMFTSGLQEAQSGLVNMDVVSHAALAATVDYMYTGLLQCKS